MDSIKEDDSEEYYCDVCENERNPMNHVYCCAKCTYIAHIGCVLSEDNISSEKDVSSSVPQSIYGNSLLAKEMEHDEVIDGIHTPQQLLNRSIIHEHSMRYYEVIEKLKKNEYCQACRMVISGPCYACETCPFEELEYYLHEKCATLPYEIQHPFHSSHVHHLTMKDSFLEDDSGEFYCYICEEERCPNDYVYCCEDCNGLFAAHVECVLAKRKGTGLAEKLQRKIRELKGQMQSIRSSLHRD